MEFEAEVAKTKEFELRLAQQRPLQGPLQPHKATVEQGSHYSPEGQAEKIFLDHRAFDYGYRAARSPGGDAESRKSRTKDAPKTPWDERPEVSETKRRRLEELLGEEAATAANEEPEVDDILKAAAEELLHGGGGVGRLTTAALAAEAAATPEGLEEPTVEPHGIFHLKSRRSYEGRSFVQPPKNAKIHNADTVNMMARKSTHTYTGHTMGVSLVEWIPSGHLLLSASMDGKIKIWDAQNQRSCVQTYIGHQHAVRDIKFTTDGSRFYSVSFDKKIFLWDTETGKVIQTMTNGATPFCLKVHPEESKQNVIIVGSQNKKAIQFDALSGEITQEYAEHLGSVNTVTFIDENRKFVTTADDRKIFVWEFGIPVVVKHIAEPHMSPAPAVSLHPSGKFIACQTLDSQIVVYEAAGRFRFQAKRRFRGHQNSSNAIRPNFSPDGRFVISGDANGRLWYWDWKNLKNLRTLQAHDGVCVDAVWHPSHPSKVATCGWDGVIKLWE